MDPIGSTASSSCIRCTLVHEYKSKIPADKLVEGLPKQYTCHTCHDLNPDFYAMICAAAETKSASRPTYKAVEFRSGYGYDPCEISLETVQEAIEKGCVSCWLLGMGIAAFFQELAENIGEFNAGNKVVLEFGPRLAVRLHLTSGEYSTGSIEAFEYYTTGNGGSPWPALSNGNHIPEQLSLDYCIAQIQAWIQHCDREHKHSPEEAEVPKLPRRLLDLNCSDAENLLSLTEAAGRTRRYVTLSHCWGQAVPLQTTKLNVADHMISIELTRLSKTFRDAIALTRGLGIRYLWIDSLCILQDDVQDWEIESAKMATIYSNSFLNIAATHAINGDHGLFSSRWREFSLKARQEKTIVSRVGIGAKEIKFKGSQPVQVYVRPSLNCCHDDLYPWLHQMPSPEAAPLLSRGWCLQERLLAPRTIHFHSAELFFECKEHCLCECGSPERLQQYGKSGPRLLQFDGITAEKSLELWLKICGSHASLCLTKSTDRLPALAGLASAFATRFGWQSSDYLAGLWKAHLPVGLLWQVFGHHAPAIQRATPYLAPTWSWASLHATSITEYSLEFLPYVGGTFDTDSRFQTMHVDCIVVGENSYGQVDTARIILYGAYVQPKRVVQAAWHSLQTYELRFGEESSHDGDDMEYLFFMSDMPLKDLFMQKWYPFPFCCLLIGMGWGLVLEPSRTTCGTYERVGVFSGGGRLSCFENADHGEFTII